jgi:hypothetical protein
MPNPNDMGDFTALLRSLADRGFWGSLTVQFQNGGLVRCVLEESVKHPRQLMGNGNTVEDQHDNKRRQ